MGAWINGMWLDAPGSKCPTCDCHVLEAPDKISCERHEQCQGNTCANEGCGHQEGYHFELAGGRHHCMTMGCDCPGFQPKEGDAP